VTIDKLVYGLRTAAIYLSSFVLVLYGFGDGNIGNSCNGSDSADCDTVFLAWEMVDMCRTFFCMQSSSKRALYAMDARCIARYIPLPGPSWPGS
jgi:hypothetical protein